MKGLENKEIEEIYKAKNSQLRRLFLRLGADSDSAEDLFHDVFVNILKFSHTYDPGQNTLHAWIRKIAVNLYYKKTTRKAREREKHKEYEIELIKESPDVSVEVLSGHLRKTLLETLQELPEPEGAILYMLRIENRKASEVSEILGLSERTVYRRLVRGMETMRKLLEEKGVEID